MTGNVLEYLEANNIPYLAFVDIKVVIKISILVDLGTFMVTVVIVSAVKY